jgi:hypothetical protein
MDAIMDAITAPHREEHHAAPEPGNQGVTHKSGVIGTSALIRIPDPSRTSREVRKVPTGDLGRLTEY